MSRVDSAEAVDNRPPDLFGIKHCNLLQCPSHFAVFHKQTDHVIQKMNKTLFFLRHFLKIPMTSIDTTSL